MKLVKANGEFFDGIFTFKFDARYHPRPGSVLFVETTPILNDRNEDSRGVFGEMLFLTVSLKSRSFVLSPRLQLEDKPNQKAAFVWLAHKVMTKNLDVFSQNWFLRASIEMEEWHRKQGRCTVFTCWVDVGQFPNNDR